MNFGTKLKMLRILHNLDQSKMSKRLNVSQPVYSRYENNEKDLTASKALILKITEEFNVTSEWLFDADNMEIGAINNSSPGHDRFEMSEKYYHIPKDFMELFLKQQQMFEKMINKIL